MATGRNIIDALPLGADAPIYAAADMNILDNDELYTLAFSKEILRGECLQLKNFTDLFIHASPT